MPETRDEYAIEFRDLQRARYLMPTTQLAAELAKERNFGARELFGISLSRKPVIEEEPLSKQDARFPDEIAALCAFLRAILALDGANRQMTRLAAALGARPRGSGGGASTVIRASSKAGRVGRVFEESVNARMLEDYVDVGSRLRGLPQDSLRLLVERFVYGRDVKEIASALGCSPPSIGGRLGQARRALRVALVDLLPKKAHGGSVEEKEPVTLPLDKVAVRRASALRHMRECLDRATGEETA